MPNIFEYNDFRAYLRDYYLENKARNYRFSYSFIAQKLGFESPSFFGHLISGRSNLSSAMTARFVLFLKLKRRAADFFETLVNYNQAKDPLEEKRHFEKLVAFKGSKIRLMGADQYEFYGKWYYPAIRELLYFHPVKGDYDALAKMLSPPIKASEARQAVQLLLRLGLARKDAQGAVVRADPLSDSTGYQAADASIYDFQQQTLALAGEAIQRFPRDTRSLSTLTFSLSQNGFDTINEELKGFRRRLLKIAEEDKAEDTVYQVNFQVFPLTRPAGGKPA
ncbi:MAG: hypothetical protein JWO30_3627 [Fibrobacteres bacterium]|nr:hypothetical protein [Fibrobacterota bacterium]